MFDSVFPVPCIILCSVEVQAQGDDNINFSSGKYTVLRHLVSSGSGSGSSNSSSSSSSSSSNGNSSSSIT